MCLGEHTLLEQATLDFGSLEVFVALDDDFAHLHLVFLVDVHIKDHLVFRGHVVTLQDFHLCVLVALVLEIALGQELGTVEHVGCDLTALEQSDFGFKVFFFRFLHSAVVDGGDTRAQGQIEMQVNLVAHDRVGSNLHF